jgi:hypothetical protein
MTGNVWLHDEPSAESPRLGVILERGQQVEILAATGEWYRVRWAPKPTAEIIGWAPSEWVGTTTAIPESIVTPTSNGP